MTLPTREESDAATPRWTFRRSGECKGCARGCVDGTARGGARLIAEERTGLGKRSDAGQPSTVPRNVGEVPRRQPLEFSLRLGPAVQLGVCCGQHGTPGRHPRILLHELSERRLDFPETALFRAEDQELQAKEPLGVGVDRKPNGSRPLDKPLSFLQAAFEQRPHTAKQPSFPEKQRLPQALAESATGLASFFRRHDVAQPHAVGVPKAVAPSCDFQVARPAPELHQLSGKSEALRGVAGPRSATCRATSASPSSLLK